MRSSRSSRRADGTLNSGTKRDNQTAETVSGTGLCHPCIAAGISRDALLRPEGSHGADDEAVNAAHLRDRYTAPGGLLRFLAEGFPNTTSKRPFGEGQIKAIEVMESVIRSGGVEQLLESEGSRRPQEVPGRSFGHFSSASATALWCFSRRNPKLLRPSPKSRTSYAGRHSFVQSSRGP